MSVSYTGILILL